MELYQYFLLGLCLISILAFILIRVFIGGLTGLMFKTLASALFVISGIFTLGITSADRLVVAFIVGGLTMGMLGDIILDLKVIYDNDAYFLNSGMLCFGIGHLFYFAGFTLLAINNEIILTMPIILSVIIAIVLTIAITLSSKTMKLDFGKFLWQTIAYTFILTFMTVYTLILAINGLSYIPFVGLVLFFFSDIVLSMQYFGGKIANKPLIAVNHGLYYLAQITLVLSLMLM